MICDTSTLAKLYAPEAHSAAVRKVLEAAPVVYASALARVELAAVFHRRWREGVWSQADFSAATRQFHHDDIGGFWTWLPVEPAILDAATHAFLTLPSTVFLRSSDCIHLVTAVHHQFADIHTHDKHQIAAATALGLNPITLT
jgi:predicted nucleic acid-binding protein